MTNEAERSKSHFWPAAEGEDKVYVNHLGIRDQAELSRVEARIIAIRYPGRPHCGRFELVELQRIHRHLFGELYGWAGHIRNYTTGRESGWFARPEFIESSLNLLLRKLAAEDHLQGANFETFIARAAHYANELNAIHPFLDGNGRTTRAFLEDLARQAGYVVDIKAIVARQDAWYEAMREGFETARPDALVELLRETTFHLPAWEAARALLTPTLTPAKAIARFSFLAPAYAHLGAVAARCNADGVAPSARTAILEQVRETLAELVQRDDVQGLKRLTGREHRAAGAPAAGRRSPRPDVPPTAATARQAPPARPGRSAS